MDERPVDAQRHRRAIGTVCLARMSLLYDRTPTDAMGKQPVIHKVRKSALPRRSRSVSGLLVGLMCASAPLVAAAPPAAKPDSAPAAKKVSPFASRELPDSAKQHFETTWGVDQLTVKLTESGQLVRFSYRVIDATKAEPLNDKASIPSLVDEQSRVALQVPTMEKVGPLRQSMAPENGKVYWMVFSNKGNYVKAGHHVSVAIGAFRVDGLYVQ